MKKIITINIASTSFFIDEDAYEELKIYQQKLDDWFLSQAGGKEIINDIEARMSELFSQRINLKTGVITSSIVQEVIKIMGQPEDFIGEEGDKHTKDPTTGKSRFSSNKRLYREVDNKILGGVCSGIAVYFNIDTTLVRIVFGLLPFLSFGVIIPVYLVLWIAVPAARTTSQRLEMRGENVTISNIQKSIKEQYNNVKSEFSNFKKSKTYKEGEAYINKMDKRDRGVLIFVSIVIAVIIIVRIIGFNSVGFHFINLPFGHVILPSIIPLLVLLLILALIFRTAIKGFLVLIALIVIIAFVIMAINSIAFFPWFLTMM